MSRLHIQPVKLRRWFPPNDDLAASIARLCILREDIHIDGRGLLAEDLGWLDGNSKRWRRLYFFRNSLRTLMEIQATVQTLLKIPEFKRMVENHKETFGDTLASYAGTLNRILGELKQYRNAVGGHVKNSDVATAINNLTFEDEGFVQIGEVHGRTHFRFVEQIVVDMLGTDVPKPQRLERIEHTVGELGNFLSESIGTIELIIRVYLIERKLI